jgi:hypothetical protein
VLVCYEKRPTDPDTSDDELSAPPESPLTTVKSRLSEVVWATREESLSDESDTEDEAGAVSSLEDPDADIRPYLSYDFESYDQDQIEEAIPNGDADAKGLEVVEVPEDEPSVIGGDAPETPNASQLVEAPEKSTILELESVDAFPDSITLDAALSPAKQPILKTAGGPAGTTRKFLFPKFTPIEFFENYLQNPSDMDYKTLYRKTAKVAKTLVAYQAEYDAVDQEIMEYEAQVKAEAKRAVEDAKYEAERVLELEDIRRDKLALAWGVHLGYDQPTWDAFVERLVHKGRISKGRDVEQLNNLRNPQFMEAAAKRRAKAKLLKTATKYANEPFPEYKPTKEEADFEKRKLGRLLDSVKFEDQKMADVYGFEYSSHPSHNGNQPLDRIVRQPPKPLRKNGESNGVSENSIISTPVSRLRAQRTKTKRLYEVDESGTSDGDEDIPAKRTRKPRIFEDGAQASSQANLQNLGPMPAAKRTFPSGKRVGRPPKAYSQSKLQAVQTVQTSPDLSSQIQGGKMGSTAGELTPGSVVEAVSAVLKRKHPGGRPRKAPRPIDGSLVGSLIIKNKGGRPRKDQTQGPSQSGAQVSPVKEEPTSAANMVQLGDADDIMQSTEVDEGSQGNSPPTSRPSSSSSFETTSSFATIRRSARASTRTKTLTRELNSKNVDEDFMAKGSNPSFSPSSSFKEKRKRGTADTEPSPIVVDAPVPIDEPSAKRRRTKARKAEGPELLTPEMGPKRKRKAGPTQGESLPKKTKKYMLDPADAGAEDELLSSVPTIPKFQSEKSKKLSASTKARWASGGMQKAQETRRANLAIKKAAKEAAAAAAAAGTAGPSNPVPIQPAAPVLSYTPPEPALPKPKTPSQNATMDGARAPSTRVKKPTRIAAGLDGPAEDNEEGVYEAPSEYERYQALTSASSPGLGKRVRRPLVDLSAMMGETSDEDYY